jgi:hypothetical protein
MPTTNGNYSEPVPNLWQTLQLALTEPSSSFQPTNTHKFLLVQGIAYALIGCLGVFGPALMADVFLIPHPSADDLGWLRIIGVAAAVIGYFYIQGARQPDIKPLMVHSTFDRLTFVPAFLIMCVLNGSSPQICIAFAIMDPLLALLTHFVWTCDMMKQR